MRLVGQFKRRKLSILIDTGSSLNFIDEGFVRGLNCDVVTIEPLRLVLGRLMLSHGRYRIRHL